jgi:hypothetical protein
MVLMLLIVGGIATLVGWVWIMVTAFTESVPWGVGIFLFSPLAFVYGILHWDDAKIPTIMMGGGVVAYIIGLVFS